MSSFVSRPNLPEDTKALLIGEKYAELLGKRLAELGLDPIFVPENPDIDIRLSGHADLSVLHAGGERVYLAPYLRGSGFAERLSALGAELCYPQIKQERAYPGDAQLNLCLVGRELFYNKRSAASEIVEYLTKSGEYRPWNGRQGYARCSMCIVSDRAVVCSDQGMHRATVSAGLDALLIEPGYIALDGFAHGFIGGAAFKLGRSVLAFTGRLYGHPSCDRILDFLRAHDIEPVYITDRPIFDIGSTIPITEK